MEDLVFNFKQELPIKYRFRQATYDCQHLLIVMSGFNIPDATMYDFSHALDNCRSAILWIKDDFENFPAYYLCNNMRFDIEQGVNLLIKGVIDFVKPNSVTILGGSKGGTAALYFGTKLNIKNIISAVPQFNIGSYVAQGYWEEVGKKMMGSINERNTKLLDEYLPGALHKDKRKDKNIYLFTSPADKQFVTEIQPNLNILSAYENFNLIESKSIYVKEHNQVTRYNLTLILSLIYQLENGITPRLGCVRNGADW